MGIVSISLGDVGGRGERCWDTALTIARTLDWSVGSSAVALGTDLSTQKKKRGGGAAHLRLLAH